MGLPWVRLDSNFHSHDKILALLNDPSAKKWQAVAVYTMALGWSGGQGTDGWVPEYAIGIVHGTHAVARLLVKYQLWDEGLAGWQIRNYADRQQLSDEAYTVRKTKQISGAKGNCVRWHGIDCGCWKNVQTA